MGNETVYSRADINVTLWIVTINEPGNEKILMKVLASSNTSLLMSIS